MIINLRRNIEQYKEGKNLDKSKQTGTHDDNLGFTHVVIETVMCNDYV